MDFDLDELPEVWYTNQGVGVGHHTIAMETRLYALLALKMRNRADSI